VRSALVIALVLTVCASAQAQDQPTLVAACSAQSGVDLRVHEQLCADLSYVMRNSRDYRVAEEDNLLCASDEFSPRAVLSDARETIAEARSNLQSGRSAQARRLASRAVEVLLSLDPWLSDRQPLAEALALEVEATVSGGNTAEAEELAVRAFGLSGLLRRTWREWIRTSALRQVLAAAEPRFDNLPTGRIEVQTREPHAEVYIDGVLVGVTPVRTHEIPRGEHVVRVRKRGYVPVSRLVRVSPGQQSSVDVRLAEARNFPAWNQIKIGLGIDLGQALAGPYLSDLGALLLVDRIVALRSSTVDGGIRLEAFLYDLRSGQLLTQASRTLTSYGPHARRDAVGALLGTLLNLAVPEMDDGSGEPPIYGTWWFWTGVGAATAAAVTLAVVFAADSEPKPTGKGAIEIRP
jgi:hypothetical protein